MVCAFGEGLSLSVCVLLSTSYQEISEYIYLITSNVNFRYLVKIESSGFSTLKLFIFPL